jgi:hypothetical protein
LKSKLHPALENGNELKVLAGREAFASLTARVPHDADHLKTANEQSMHSLKERHTENRALARCGLTLSQSQAPLLENYKFLANLES